MLDVYSIDESDHRVTKIYTLYLNPNGTAPELDSVFAGTATFIDRPRNSLAPIISQSSPSSSAANSLSISYYDSYINENGNIVLGTYNQEWVACVRVVLTGKTYKLPLFSPSGSGTIPAKISKINTEDFQAYPLDENGTCDSLEYCELYYPEIYNFYRDNRITINFGANPIFNYDLVGLTVDIGLPATSSLSSSFMSSFSSISSFSSFSSSQSSSSSFSTSGPSSSAFSLPSSSSLPSISSVVSSMSSPSNSSVQNPALTPKRSTKITRSGSGTGTPTIYPEIEDPYTCGSDIGGSVNLITSEVAVRVLKSGQLFKEFKTTVDNN